MRWRIGRVDRHAPKSINFGSCVYEATKTLTGDEDELTQVQAHEETFKRAGESDEGYIQVLRLLQDIMPGRAEDVLILASKIHAERMLMHRSAYGMESS